MIARVSRGSGMVGLMRYLAGPGKRNEHSDPHLVAGDGAVVAWWDDAQLDRDAATRIGAHLDGARRATGTDVAGGHVWHCSLSLPAGDGELSDERWAAITGEFVAEMGFAGDGAKAPCRWAAVRHGVSANGNDHVHLVVSLVRDDGTKADTWRDYARASAAVAGLEARHGLTVVESRQLGRGSVGVTGAEVNKATRLGDAEPARSAVSRRVRAAAVASRTEAEFVRRARRDGLLVRPRFAAGTQDVVVGYSAAVKPASRDERPVWFGGGRLDRDLSLPRLREQWPDTPHAASAAAAEWTAAARHRRPVAPGRETREVDPRLVEQARRDVVGIRAWLRTVDPADTATWAGAARETSGMFAALSARVEVTPGPLARAADQLARSAQYRAGAARGQRPPGIGATRVAAYALQATPGVPRPIIDAVLLRQLTMTANAIHNASRAAGDARQARALAATIRQDLAAVHSAEASAAVSAGRPTAVGAERPGPEPAVRAADGAPLLPPVPEGIDPDAARAARQLAVRRHGVGAPTPAAPGGAPTGSDSRRRVEPDQERGIDR